MKTAKGLVTLAAAMLLLAAVTGCAGIVDRPAPENQSAYAPWLVDCSGENISKVWSCRALVRDALDMTTYP